MKRKNKQFKKGFTLVELMVAIGVFVIVATASLSIYMAVLNLSHETTAKTRIQQETQFLLEVLAKKIRTSLVDYDYYLAHPGILDVSGEASQLVLKVDSDQYIFKQKDSSIAVGFNPASENDYKIIPTTNVSISDLKFFINPTTNPYSLSAPPASQPYVTISLEVSSVRGRQSASLLVQETVPQRSGGEID